MNEPKALKIGERAAPEHLHPNDYWDLNAKWRVESAFITNTFIPQRAADAGKTLSSSLAEREFAAYAEDKWNLVDTELRQSYCGGGEIEDSAIFDMAKHDKFQAESPKSGAVTRLLILFWIAALCEATIFVVQGIFSGGFNPIIILLAVLLAFGGFLTGAGIGKMLYGGWRNAFLHEPHSAGGVVWAQAILGCILMVSVAAFRAYGAGELVPGIFAFLITILLGSLCALFETLHQLTKLKREECLRREGQAQMWTAYETHKVNFPKYKEQFVSELSQRAVVGGNITATRVKPDGLITLVNTAKSEV